jgi:hypothetical protein
LLTLVVVCATISYLDRGCLSVAKRFLFLDQPTLKDRPRIKACVIGPPETPSVVIAIFLNGQVNQ